MHVQLLATLKILPVADRAVLRESRVLVLVEKWSQNQSTVESTSTTTNSTMQAADSTGSHTTVSKDDKEQEVKSGDSNAAGISSSFVTGSSPEIVPHKKRHLFYARQQHLAASEEISSSDSEVADNVVQSTTGSQCDDKLSTVVDSSDAMKEMAGDEKADGKNICENSSELQSMASELLACWKTLQVCYVKKFILSVVS